MSNHPDDCGIGREVPWSDEEEEIFPDQSPEERLIEMLLSEEYLPLLEKAIMARYGTSTNNKDLHAEAYGLILDYKSSKMGG